MGETKRRFGDRKDGRLLRSLSSKQRIALHLMHERNDAQLFYEESFDVRSADKMLRRARVAGYKNMSMLHFVIAVYVRCLSMLPGVNRFVSGRRVFARNHIEIVLRVKRSNGSDSSDFPVKVRFEPTDTIYDIYRKINQRIDEIRSGEERNTTDDLLDAVAGLPRFLLRALTDLINTIDYFGWLPQSLIQESPFHGSVSILNTADLRIGPMYRHIPNFGNLPVTLSFGAKHHKYEVNRHGEVEDNKYIDCRFVLDERIVDHHYFSQFLQAMKYIFQHPEITELPPSRINEDVE